jgi:hypothetical protein
MTSTERNFKSATHSEQTVFPLRAFMCVAYCVGVVENEGYKILVFYTTARLTQVNTHARAHTTQMPSDKQFLPLLS